MNGLPAPLLVSLVLVGCVTPQSAARDYRVAFGCPAADVHVAERPELSARAIQPERLPCPPDRVGDLCWRYQHDQEERRLSDPFSTSDMTVFEVTGCGRIELVACGHVHHSASSSSYGTGYSPSGRPASGSGAGYAVDATCRRGRFLGTCPAGYALRRGIPGSDEGSWCEQVGAR